MRRTFGAKKIFLEMLQCYFVKCDLPKTMNARANIATYLRSMITDGGTNLWNNRDEQTFNWKRVIFNQALGSFK